MATKLTTDSIKILISLEFLALSGPVLKSLGVISLYGTSSLNEMS